MTDASPFFKMSNRLAACAMEVTEHNGVLVYHHGNSFCLSVWASGGCCTAQRQLGKKPAVASVAGI